MKIFGISTRERFLVLGIVAGLVGCGASAPEHAVKPLKARPVVQNPFTSASTAEDKIRFIQGSKAPDSVKESAIARVKAGQL
jgi:hypothetical protein